MNLGFKWSLIKVTFPLVMLSELERRLTAAKRNVWRFRKGVWKWYYKEEELLAMLICIVYSTTKKWHEKPVGSNASSPPSYLTRFQY